MQRRNFLGGLVSVIPFFGFKKECQAELISKIETLKEFELPKIEENDAYQLWHNEEKLKFTLDNELKENFWQGVTKPCFWCVSEEITIAKRYLRDNRIDMVIALHKILQDKLITLIKQGYWCGYDNICIKYINSDLEYKIIVTVDVQQLGQ